MFADLETFTLIHSVQGLIKRDDVIKKGGRREPGESVMSTHLDDDDEDDYDKDDNVEDVDTGNEFVNHY